MTGAEISGGADTARVIRSFPVRSTGMGWFISVPAMTQATLLAIRPDGMGDITETHVEWKISQGVPLNPSLLLVDESLYLMSDLGVLTCLNAKTGKKRWQGRLGGNFSASPVFAGGHLYFLSENAVTHVVAPGDKFQKIATNKLTGRSLASPAVSGNALYIRTDKALYRIEHPEPESREK